MSMGSFFEEAARTRTAETIAEVESHTSAEVVVAVRRAAGDYRHADYLFGFLLSLGVLSALLYLPQEFPIATFPLDVALGFAVGAFFCARVPPLRQLLSGRGRRAKATRTAAEAAFHTLGISRTSGRTGLLVFVSLFERRVEVVHDVGVEPEMLGEEWTRAVERLERSVAGSPNLDAFLDALSAFGPLLGRVLERSEDDVNELPDMVHV